MQILSGNLTRYRNHKIYLNNIFVIRKFKEVICIFKIHEFQVNCDIFLQHFYMYMIFFFFKDIVKEKNIFFNFLQIFFQVSRDFFQDQKHRFI